MLGLSHYPERIQKMATVKNIFVVLYDCDTCEGHGSIALVKGELSFGSCKCEQLIPDTPTPTPF
jgi:hypothetical protein